jgi:putative heme transporter
LTTRLPALRQPDAVRPREPVVPAVTVPAAVRDPDSAVPYPLRVAAAISWRVLLVLALLAVIGWALIKVSVVVIPVAVALLLAALLSPAVDGLGRRGVPRALATVVVMVGGLAALGGLLTFVVRAFISGLPDMQTQVTASIETIKNWLVTGPFQLSQADLDNAITSLTNTLAENRQVITSGALTTVSSVGHFVTGALLALFTLAFFLYDGRRIWAFLMRAVPREQRDRVDLAGERGFASLVGYVRASVLVAMVDAVGIGLGLWVMGVPLVVPLAALVFLAAFIPIVGAVIAGAVAVLVALVTKGLITAVIVLGIVIAVQQIEGHVLQPVLMGRAVALHPLAVVLAVAAGAVVAGIVGALLAVPSLAVVNAGIRSLLGEDAQAVQPEAVDATDPMEGAPADTPESELAEPRRTDRDDVTSSRSDRDNVTSSQDGTPPTG